MSENLGPSIIKFIREQFPAKTKIPLHEPTFSKLESSYVQQCLDENFVSSVGPFVTEFEKKIAEYTGSRHAVATSCGTSALHLALVIAGVKASTEVLTQSLTFVATANAISYCSAEPIFIDSDPETLGMDPESLQSFLESHSEVRGDGLCYNLKTGRQIVACVPMHVFGHPCKLLEIKGICERYGLVLIEDAAESLGSTYQGQHTGTIGAIGVLSFNGNKIITTGGGGMVLIQDPTLAARAKHLSTTAKVPHPWEFYHDEVGYNYRLPNINAALGLGQLERLPLFLLKKRELAMRYKEFFLNKGIEFLDEPPGSQSNFWLNTILFDHRKDRDSFLKVSNEEGIFARPIWNLMTDLPAFKNSQQTSLPVARNFYERAVNIPSSVIV